MSGASATLNKLWEWPTNLAFSTLLELDKYNKKDELYTSIGFAVAVYLITRRLELSGVALIYFIGAKGGSLVKVCVVAAIYAWRRGNILLLGAIAALWYLLAGFKL